METRIRGSAAMVKFLASALQSAKYGKRANHITPGRGRSGPLGWTGSSRVVSTEPAIVQGAGRIESQWKSSKSLALMKNSHSSAHSSHEKNREPPVPMTWTNVTDSPSKVQSTMTGLAGERVPHFADKPSRGLSSVNLEATSIQYLARVTFRPARLNPTKLPVFLSSFRAPTGHRSHKASQPSRRQPLSSAGVFGVCSIFIYCCTEVSSAHMQPG
ncbi:hypothetical protein GGR56DRAFT_291557 [Xylariaceae sp. FL0804]|nr:hypothetical protein GGR56DRAFT_291557 [Xylariaceae sp. FL0804]